MTAKAEDSQIVPPGTQLESADDQKFPLNPKLDRTGLPLEPQPSDHKDDPLNWPQSYKIWVLVQLILLSFCVQLTAGFLPAAFSPIAKELNKTNQQASYLVSSYVLLGGLTPLFITPFANLYGRRFPYIIFTLIAVLSLVGGALATSYAGLLVSRVFTGIGQSVALGIGASTITDLFFQHERGKFMVFIVL